MLSLNILPTQRVTPKTWRVYAILHMLNKVTQLVCQNLFFLAEILLVEIDDFRPNLVGVAHIWPLRFIAFELLLLFVKFPHGDHYCL
jgi:hypothetical protein